MGQYYYAINLDKKQFLHPHRFGDGLKLMEFGASAGGTMTALAILLSDGNGRGGGDFRGTDDLVGSWAGDRIVVAGDYADNGKWLPEGFEGTNLHCYASDHFEDISRRVFSIMDEAKETRAHW